MSCLSRYIQPPSPLARPFLAQQDEQREETPVNVDELTEIRRNWKRPHPLLRKLLRAQILNKKMENPVTLQFHVFIGAPNTEGRCYVTRKVLTMRRLTEYVHVDFTNEIDLPVEVTLVCQTFGQGDALVFHEKDVRRWEGYCDIHGNNKKVKRGFPGKLKARLISTNDGPSLAFA